MKCSNLDVWKLSVELSIEIYKYFADGKDYGFKDQITRCSLSIPSNIAEGMEKMSVKEQIRFLDISKGSSAEFITHTTIGMGIGYIDDIGNKWIVTAEHILSMLTKLQRYLSDKSDGCTNRKS
jgi:four helix bundle protein